MLSLSRKGLLSVIVVCVLLSSGLGVYAGYYAGVHGPSPNPNPSQIGDVWTGDDIYYTGELYQGAGGTALTSAITTKEASYIVWKDGSTYYALNGATGETTSNANARTLIQGLLDTQEKGIYFLKTGTYTIDNYLNLYSGQTLAGEGWSTKIILANNVDPVYIIFANAKQNVTVRDLEINGNKAQNSDGVGVWFLTGINCYALNLHIIDVKVTGLVSSFGARNCYFENNLVEDSGAHGIWAGDYSVVKYNRVINSAGFGIISGSFSEISNNYVELSGNGVNNYSGIRPNNGEHDLKIISNTGTLNGAELIDVFDISNSTIIGNIAYKNVANGITCYGGKGVIISNNIAYNNSMGGIYISPYAGIDNPNKITVEGNQAYYNNYCGIKIDRGLNCIVSGNLVFDNSQDPVLTHHGILLQNTNNSIITINRIFDDQAIKTQQYGFFSGDSIDNIISNNDFTGNTYSAGWMGASTGNKINNNQGYVTENEGTELIPTTLLDHCTSGLYSNLTVGVSVTVGQVLFVNNTDGKLWKADATDNTTIPCVVIATTSITAGNAGYVLNQGYFRDNSWGWAPGGILYLSETAGAMTQTPPAGTGKQVQVLGYALTADIIYFDPNFMVLELS